MKPTRKTTALALAACTLPALASQAAELQQPTQLFTAGIAANPPSNAANPPGSLTNCPALSASGPISPGRLVVRNTDRPDVGPYTVKLPGYAADPASSAADSYRPFLVTASPGDTLRFDIVNQLDPAGSYSGITNLHTHGLIVSPRPCVPLGDYVFVEDNPGTTTYYRMDIPATLPGYMFGSQTTPRPYPSGLNWFHAHVHGQARFDVMAGQAGMLYVGDLRRDLLEAPNLAAASAATLNRTDTLYLGLRDIQLAVPPGATPDAARPGLRAEPLFGVDYNPKACPAQANPPQPGISTSGPGYCASPGVTIGGKPDTTRDRVWLHTINGQHNPTITLQPGRNQIWRIANLSANVTYVLELDDAAGQGQALNALSIDGLVVWASNSSSCCSCRQAAPRSS